MKMQKNVVVITIVSVLALFGFLTIVYLATNQSSDNVIAEAKTLKADDHLKWNTTAKKNILVEYSDLQCPSCRNFHTILKNQIEPDKNIVNNITFVYRHFPLFDIHPHAMEAAYAAEAAGKQGKFFEMTDVLFDSQPSWENLSNVKDYFDGLAKKLSLDVEKFNTDMDSKEVKNRVDEDLQSGNRVGVNATPTFYLNGKKVDVTTVEDFKKLLDTTASGK